MKTLFALPCCLLLAAGCQTEAPPPDVKAPSLMQRKLAQYTTLPIAADLSALTENERRMIPLLVEASQAMDEIFWLETHGDRAGLLNSVADSDMRRYIEINYGPWDRLDDNHPFVEGTQAKPKGSGFYPADMSKEEFEAAAAESPERGRRLKSLYTIVRRDANRKLVAVPYREAFAEPTRRAADKLKAAAQLAEDAGLKRYLNARSGALLSDNYQASDLAWMDMKTNRVDVVIGPIETYEDELFGYKAAHEAYVLIKDKDWSARLARYAGMLPALQRALPVPEAYKSENPGSASDLNAYDAIFFAGEANAGPKTIAINLPNDEAVQIRKGTRRLQLKNAMRAKFDRIVVPINAMVTAEDQRGKVTFDAFFANVMFHEIAHGLGVKSTIDRKGTVREALKEQASALEEAKADVLGLFMVTQLHKRGEMGAADLEDNYVSFLASIFRSIRFGAANAHGRANLMEFNFLLKNGAFTRNDTGAYSVNFEQMQKALDGLSAKILQFQGDGDYNGVKAFMRESGQIGAVLRADLDRMASANIPVDIVFDQAVTRAK